MSKLTTQEIKKTANELMYYKDKLANGIFGDRIGCFDKSVEALKELQHYKDLEEQGRLIEQKHGRWKIIGMRPVGTHLTHYCSICGGHGDNEMDYCPNCGAKMDEVE